MNNLPPLTSTARRPRAVHPLPILAAVVELRQIAQDMKALGFSLADISDEMDRIRSRWDA